MGGAVTAAADEDWNVTTEAATIITTAASLNVFAPTGIVRLQNGTAALPG
jgi:hypothetical protein